MGPGKGSWTRGKRTRGGVSYGLREGLDDQVQDGVGAEDGDDAEGGPDDGLLGLGDLLGAAGGQHPLHAAPDKHQERDPADDAEDRVDDASDDAGDGNAGEREGEGQDGAARAEEFLA